jgi:hypothetical protein
LESGIKILLPVGVSWNPGVEGSLTGFDDRAHGVFIAPSQRMRSPFGLFLVIMTVVARLSTSFGDKTLLALGCQLKSGLATIYIVVPWVCIVPTCIHNAATSRPIKLSLDSLLISYNVLPI